MAPPRYSIRHNVRWLYNKFLPSVGTLCLQPTNCAPGYADEASVMKGLGRGDVETLLLTTPPYLIGAVALIANAWLSDKTGERFLHILIPAVLAIAAFILGAATTSFVPRYM